ncbi:MAG TPA: T9SS type A sorting domain-containing protein, partial [Ignavibacteria bacterium]
CNFMNNIIPKGRYDNQIQTYFTTSPDYYDSTKWMFKKNCFIDDYPTGFPAIFYTNNISGYPQFIDTSSTLPLNPLNYKIPITSNCNNAGVKINGITSDYWYAIRDSITPCIGFHEYGGASGINVINNEIPSTFSLSQNYPNPFNPTTNIRYQIPNNSFVTLKIYDVLGREVQILVNESLKPGTYETSFDGSTLNSGVYFYKISAGDFSETKKMLMVK